MGNDMGSILTEGLLGTFKAHSNEDWWQHMNIKGQIVKEFFYAAAAYSHFYKGEMKF